MYSTPSLSTILPPAAHPALVLVAVVPLISLASLPTNVTDSPVALDVNVAPSFTVIVVATPFESLTATAPPVKPFAATSAVKVYLTPF